MKYKDFFMKEYKKEIYNEYLKLKDILPLEIQGILVKDISYLQFRRWFRLSKRYKHTKSNCPSIIRKYPYVHILDLEGFVEGDIDKSISIKYGKINPYPLGEYEMQLKKVLDLFVTTEHPYGDTSIHESYKDNDFVKDFILNNDKTFIKANQFIPFLSSDMSIDDFSKGLEILKFSLENGIEVDDPYFMDLYKMNYGV